MNIAQQYIEYYESDNFYENYAIFLFSDMDSIEQAIQQVIHRIEPHNLICVTREEAGKMAEYIYQKTMEDPEEYIKTFSNYWVGDTSVCSVCFGEQEVQLTGITNHKTNKPYNKKYLTQVFDNEGFYIDEKKEYAYLDLSSEGLHIDLEDFFQDQDEIKNFLNKQITTS